MANELISIERLSDFHADITVDAHILKRSTAYAVDDKVNKGLIYLKCTQDGTTASTALSLTNVSVGDTVTDGTVVWEVISIKGVPESGGTASGIAIWATGKVYKVNDMVLYEDVMYKCNTQHTSSTFSTDASKWDFVYNNIQDWQATTFYKDGSTVIHNHKLYQCVTEHTSTSVWDESKWQLIGDESGAGLEDWESNHDYAVDDIYVYEGEIYKTLIAFTSGATEDSRTKVNNIVPSVWAANTVYTAGDIIEHTDVTTLKKVYYNVTDDFTSGATFEVTAQMQELQIVEEYVPNPLTQQQVKNLIDSFVPSGSGTDPIFYNDSPIGTIIAYMGITAPKDYLACDGQTYNIVDYKELAEYIKVQFGSYDYFGGNGTTTFAVPDLRGEFLRGTGTNSHSNQGNGASVGVHQDGSESPTVWNTGSSDKRLVYTPVRTNGNLSRNEDNLIPRDMSTVDYFSDISYVVRTDTVTQQATTYTSRPTNTSVLYCIKYNTSILSTPENNYSTEEQRIGTWIDGKPLYQITIQDTMPTVTTDGTQVGKNIDISSIGIKKVINYSSIQFNLNAEYITTNSVNSISSINYFSTISFYNSQSDINGVIDSIFLGSTRTVDSERPVYITVQYTKTTD